jgi:hypothetical protein
MPQKLRIAPIAPGALILPPQEKSVAFDLREESSQRREGSA